jgi:hypothetical protein
VDVALGRRHLLEQGGELLGAGREDVDAVGRERRGPALGEADRLDARARRVGEVGHGRLRELRVGGRHRPERLLGDRVHLGHGLPASRRVAPVVAADEEVRDQSQHGEQQDDEGRGERDGP